MIAIYSTVTVVPSGSSPPISGIIIIQKLVLRNYRLPLLFHNYVHSRRRDVVGGTQGQSQSHTQRIDPHLELIA